MGFGEDIESCPMNETELLIKIKTALEAGGAEAAKRELDSLIGKTNQATGATANQTKGVHDAVRSQQVLEGALRGNWRALGQLSERATGLGGALTKTIPVVGAFMAGWQAGWKIGEWIASWAVKIDQFAAALNRAEVAAAQLNSQKMDALRKELDSVSAAAEKAATEIDKATSQENRLARAKADVGIAKIEATMPEGPEREKAIANVRFRTESEIKERELAAAGKKASASESVITRHAAALAKAKREEEAARQEFEGYAKSGALKGDMAEDAGYWHLWSGLREGEGRVSQASVATMNYRAARQRRAEAEKRFGESWEKTAPAQKEFSVEAEVAAAGVEAAKFAHTGAVAGIDAREAERRKREAAKVERDRIEEQIRQTQAEYEGKHRFAAGRVSETGMAAKEAEERSESFDSSKGRYGTKNALRAAQAHDAELAQIAAEARANHEEMKAVLSETVQQQKNDIEVLRSQIKNLPGV